MIDSLYGYAAKEEQIDGLRKLGLNPATMKYLIVSHGHGDHHGGAKLLQDEFGPRVVMGGPDWDLVAKTAQNTPPPKKSGPRVSYSAPSQVRASIQVPLGATCHSGRPSAS